MDEEGIQDGEEMGVKINASVDTETKQLISVAITDERVADTKMFCELVGRARENIELNGKWRVIRVIADGEYDSNKNFEFAERLRIIPVIKVRAPEKISARSKNLRKKYGKMIKEFGYGKWKDIFSYGRRWVVEAVFSGFKRRFGEFVRAKKKENIFQEVKLKCMVYNLMVRYDLTGFLHWE
ncbi:MAG: transposase [Thermoplasmata archaeon]